jgi:soluble lytic murein transglycosylase
MSKWYIDEMKRIFFVSLILLCIASAVNADIYKFVDGNGVTHFTNIPRGDEYRKVISASTEQSGGSFDPIIQQKSRKYDIDPSIIRALISAESSWDVHAISNKGAIGLMQLMPATARDMKIKNPFDPEQNIEGGTRYLRMLLDRFNGNMELAVAAYNAGPAAVEKSGGIPLFSETRKFVRNVISSYRKKSDDKRTRIHKITNDDSGRRRTSDNCFLSSSHVERRFFLIIVYSYELSGIQ